MKKILCLLLAISLAVSVAVIAPVTASAAETKTAVVGAAETDGSSVGTISVEGYDSISLGDKRSFTIRAGGGSGAGLKYVAEKDMKICFAITTDTNPEYGFPNGTMYDSGLNTTEYDTKTIGDSESGPHGFKIICDVTAGETYYFTIGFHFANGDFSYDVDETADVSVSLTEFSLFQHSGGTITGYEGTDTEIVIPSEINGEAITEIGYYAFYNSDIESVTILNSVTSINEGAFYGCTNLENLTIPESVTSIGSCAFMECTSLESVTINAKISEIEYSTFEGCTSLKNVTLPDSLKYIDEYAFTGCTALESITIPDSVSSIDEQCSPAGNSKVCYSSAGVHCTPLRMLIGNVVVLPITCANNDAAPSPSSQRPAPPRVRGRL